MSEAVSSACLTLPLPAAYNNCKVLALEDTDTIKSPSSFCRLDGKGITDYREHTDIGLAHDGIAKVRLGVPGSNQSRLPGLRGVSSSGAVSREKRGTLRVNSFV